MQITIHRGINQIDECIKENRIKHNNMAKQTNPKSLKDYFQPEVLDPNNPLFEELAKDPLWWKMIREDKDLYVNIRKYNRINVYYRGASVMSLEHNGEKITAEIHNHYLGVEKPIATLLGTKYGNVKSLSPEELVCRLALIKKRIAGNSKFKSNLAETDIPQGEFVNYKDAFSEKAVQAKMYLTGEYIDTEFAVRLDDGTDIRIDLISLTKDNLIQFEELKLIGDSRLRSGNLEDSEILVQMGNYATFINDVSQLKNGNNLMVVDYYRKVLEIMNKIHVLPLRFRGRKIEGLSDYVHLFIDDSEYYRKPKHPGRVKRLADIKKLLEAHGVKSNIDKAILSYNQFGK